MAQDSTPNATPTTQVGTADVANASALVESVSVIRQALSTSSDAIVTKLTAIAAAITASLIGGTTGTTANRILVAKGTTGRALQPTATALDPSTGIFSGTAIWQGTVISPVYGGTGVANNAANLLTWSGNFAATFTLTAGTAVTFPTSGTLATLSTNAWVQQQGFGTQALTDAATIAWNLQTQQVAKVTLGGNRTLGAPTNMVDGFTYILRVIQDGTGSRTLAYNGVFKWPGGVAPILSTAAGAIDILTFVSDGTNMDGVIQKAFA